MKTPEQFLQENDMSGDYELYRVGKVVARKRIILVDSLSKDLKNIALDDQLTIAGVLGSYLHQAYCDGRRLEDPLPNGLLNEPSSLI